MVEVALEVLNVHHGVARAVEHDAECREGALLGLGGDGAGENVADHADGHVGAAIRDDIASVPEGGGADAVGALLEDQLGGAGGLLRLEGGIALRQHGEGRGDDGVGCGGIPPVGG